VEIGGKQSAQSKNLELWEGESEDVEITWKLGNDQWSEQWSKAICWFCNFVQSLQWQLIPDGHKKASKPWWILNIWQGNGQSFRSTETQAEWAERAWRDNCQVKSWWAVDGGFWKRSN
jgi:hypothetical protein